VSAKALSKRLREVEAKALDADFARLARLWRAGFDEKQGDTMALFRRALARHGAKGGSLEAFLARLPREMSDAVRLSLRVRLDEMDAA
jgi:hypothetical protein